MIRKNEERDFGAIQHIWEVCFHDEPAYIMRFLQHYPDASGWIYEENQQVVSMLFLLPVTVFLKKGYYVYACATLPKFQGKGFMKMLLEHIFQISQKENAFGLFLIPGNKALFDYYQKLDYQIFSSISETKFQHDNRTVFLKNLKTSNNASEIYRIRQKFYTDTGDVQWSEKHIRFVLEQIKQERGEAFIVENQSSSAYALCINDTTSKEITVLEWAVISDDFENDCNIFFNAICRYFETSELKIRSKIGCCSGVERPFSMVRLCFEGKIPNNAYLNLGLD